MPVLQAFRRGYETIALLEQATELTFNVTIPPFDGEPREVGECRTLRKGDRVASCQLWSHPLGGEVRLEVDGLWCRGETHREGLALVDTALEWKRQFEGKGWR